MVTTTKNAKSTSSSKKKNLRLIVSEEGQPVIQIKPGMKLEVVGVTIVEPTLKKSKAKAARLCGGTDTCLALIEI